ncbi:DNA-processing protein DprA [Verrucomicrobiota bacterium]
MHLLSTTVPAEDSRDMDEREAYVALNMMEKVGPVGVRALTEALGSAGAIMQADRQALLGAKGIGPEQAGAIVEQRKSVDPAAELDKAERLGVRIVTQIDEEYPPALKEIHDPPLAIYVKGSLKARDRHAVAVVGTRRPTHYGRGVAEKLAWQLAEAGMTVVSGLAEGIDTVAHRGALKGAGRTLAVLGGALDRVYPRSNTGLAGDVAGQGAVISEFPFGREPDKTTFPMRNRIVSGISMGVVVVEAGSTSGALITAREALDQGRSVFAVPGRIDSPASSGTNTLIRDGAKVVTCVEDVLDEFEFLIAPEQRAARAPEGGLRTLAPEERVLVDLLEEGERDVDSLIRESGMSPAEVSSVLLRLEMKKVVRMLPGRMVERRRGGI